LGLGRHLLDKSDVPPGGRAQAASIVVTFARQSVTVGGKLIPLLARYLTGFTAYTYAGVGEKPGCH